MFTEFRRIWYGNRKFGPALAVSLAAGLSFIFLFVLSFFISVLIYIVDNVPKNNLIYKPELDLLYDVANILLPFMTFVALILAWGQLRSSERTSKGAMYIGLFEAIVADLNDVGALTSELNEQYQIYCTRTAHEDIIREDEYISSIINEWHVDIPYNVILTRFLTSLENIGLLARQGYISMDDVYLLLEGPLKNIIKIYGLYIQQSKDYSRLPHEADGRLLEHAHWLLVEIKSYELKSPLPPTRGRLP